MKKDEPQVFVQVPYPARSTMPAKLEAKAQELDLTVGELCRRFITAGMAQYEPAGAAEPGETLDDLFVRNGFLKPVEDDESKVTT